MQTKKKDISFPARKYRWGWVVCAAFFCAAAGAVLLLMPKHPPAAKLVDLLAKNKFADAESKFDAGMKSALPENELRAVWEKVTGSVGPLQTELGTRTGRLDGYDVVYVGCQFQKKRLDIKVVFDSDRKVAGLFFVTPGSR